MIPKTLPIIISNDQIKVTIQKRNLRKQFYLNNISQNFSIFYSNKANSRLFK